MMNRDYDERTRSMLRRAIEIRQRDTGDDSKSEGWRSAFDLLPDTPLIMVACSLSYLLTDGLLEKRNRTSGLHHDYRATEKALATKELERDST